MEDFPGGCPSFVLRFQSGIIEEMGAPPFAVFERWEPRTGIDIVLDIRIRSHFSQNRGEVGHPPISCWRPMHRRETWATRPRAYVVRIRARLQP